MLQKYNFETLDLHHMPQHAATRSNTLIPIALRYIYYRMERVRTNRSMWEHCEIYLLKLLQLCSIRYIMSLRYLYKVAAKTKYPLRSAKPFLILNK